MRQATLPITLIVLGVSWLVWYYGLFPDTDWLIAAGLIASGVSVLIFDGITKSAVVIGPLMMACGGAWLLHDRNHLPWAVLLPVLLICLGVFMLVSRLEAIPEQRKNRSADAS
jgi:hypothetical protein